MQGVPQSGGTHDWAHLQSTMRAIELACSSIQLHSNPAKAEATILSLSQSPRPYQACQFILETSTMPTARFQAAAAMRDAAIREWGFLSADVKRGLISFCLCFVMQHANSPDGYVQVKVSSVAAQLMKRGWLEFTATDKQSLFFQVNQAVSGVHGVDVQFIGINFLESLVSEFSPSTSSAMGLPREFHEQCQKSLELDYLKMFYSWARDAASSVTHRIVESDLAVPEVKVCSAALRFMHQILNWDFQCRTDFSNMRMASFSDGIKHDVYLSGRSECNIVQPDPGWRDILFSSGHVGWLLSLYAALRHKFSSEGYWLDCPIAVCARKLIVQFCSLGGPIFVSDNGDMHGNHLLQLLSGIIQWVDPPDAVCKAIDCGRSESELLDGCRALLSIASVTTPLVFDQLLKSLRHYGTLRFLSTLMSEVIKILVNEVTDEEIWSSEARDILLDAWTAILMPLDISNEIALFPQEGVKAAAMLFSCIVEAELKVASLSAFNDDGDTYYFHASTSAMDERLSSYALIARIAADVTIPLLMRMFSERTVRLNQGKGIMDLTETLEELYSLLLITGHALADEGEGEIPLVPSSFRTHFMYVTEAEKHPVVLLSVSIIKFAEQSLNPELRASVFSPRLMESIIWFLARWSRTYLMPVGNSNFSPGQVQEHHSWNTLHIFFGEHHQGKSVLDVIVRIALTTLKSYPGEKHLQALTCYQLLHSLVLQKHICIHLVALNSWHDLANAFSKEKTLFLLDASHQRSLAQTLVRSASGMGNSEASNKYVRDLMGPMTTYLVELSSKNDFKGVAQQPDIVMMVSCLLERLRGAASASEPRMQKAIYELGFSVRTSIVILLEVYKHESAVVYRLLKFAVAWVDVQINYLEAKETAVVIDFCMHLLQLYSSHNIGKISLSISNSLLNEANAEKYKDLRALLQLLSSLCSKDLIDFSSDTIETQGSNISQVVYFGFHIVTPLISLELLKYPKLCHDFFSLLSHMLEVYPETFAQLNSEPFAYVLGTLDFGLQHQDIEVVSKCLRSLQALASYHFKETTAGKIGLGSHASNLKDSSGKLQGVLSPFLHSVLQLLLLGDYSSDLIGIAADALLPLILCEQSLYQSLGNELIDRQADPVLRSRLANALHNLTSANQLSYSLDRINSQRFRKNLNYFLIEVRGFLRKL